MVQIYTLYTCTHMYVSIRICTFRVHSLTLFTPHCQGGEESSSSSSNGTFQPLPLFPPLHAVWSNVFTQHFSLAHVSFAVSHVVHTQRTTLGGGMLPSRGVATLGERPWSTERRRPSRTSFSTLRICLELRRKLLVHALHVCGGANLGI